jgi:TRAP-type uncharacterized transport system substrate-binding protein
MKREPKLGLSRVLLICSEYFGLNRILSATVVCFIAVVTCLAIFWFIHSAPPRVLTITSGPPGSAFETNAIKYAAYLAKKGVTLKILSSQGSFENLQRLENPRSRVDVGFVQGGITDGTNSQNLVSLGSISYEPLLVFYRGTNTVKWLSQFEGRRLAVGSEGSGTRSLALTLLQTNGVAPGGDTDLEALDADNAAQALLAGKVDAVFLTSDSASFKTIRLLLRAPDIKLMNFEQADAYTRRFNYLNKLRLPEGAIDFSKNLPAQDVLLIGPTVELIARPDLNPAVSDLLLEAAQDAHGKATTFQNQGEFPAPLVHEFKISPDALRYYKSGKTFLYRELPFWIASLVNRVLVAFVPIVLVLIPALRIVPAAYKWRSQLRIYRWYRKLLVLEREVTGDLPPGKREELLRQLNEIESVVKQMKVPASFANLFYSLREHIDYVREKLTARTPAAGPSPAPDATIS